MKQSIVNCKVSPVLICEIFTFCMSSAFSIGFLRPLQNFKCLKVVVFVFNLQTTAKVIWRQGHG